MNEQPIKYRSLNNYLKEKFGEKVYKLSLSCSDTCPNRDGKCGRGGCIFCAEGSGAFATKYSLPVEEQIEAAKKLIRNKTDCRKFIAYFQSFTSTYGDLKYIEECLLTAANNPEIVAVSVATRPDCLGEEVMAILKKVNAIKPVTVELGLQSIHESTAEFINRGYPLSVFDHALSKLKASGLEVVVHVILGLPYETEKMMLETVQYVANSSADGIKLQLLHVLRDTPLAELYSKGAFKALEFREYIEILKKCVALLPQRMVVHRLTGDGDKKRLIAPLWSADKRRVLNEISRHLKPI